MNYYTIFYCDRKVLYLINNKYFKRYNRHTRKHPDDGDGSASFDLEEIERKRDGEEYLEKYETEMNFF
jgi:hypothetical protein